MRTCACVLGREGNGGERGEETGLSISVRSVLLERLLWIKGRGSQRVELLDISEMMQLLVEVTV